MNEANNSPAGVSGEAATEPTIEQSIAKNIAERQAQIGLLEIDDHFMNQHWDSLDPSLRVKLRDLYQQEVEAFRALDPQTTTPEDITVIIYQFFDLRQALNPNKDKF